MTFLTAASSPVLYALRSASATNASELQLNASTPRASYTAQVEVVSASSFQPHLTANVSYLRFKLESMNTLQCMYFRLIGRNKERKVTAKCKDETESVRHSTSSCGALLET